MSKAIQRGETAGAATRRALLSSLERARAAVEADDPELVHEVRRRLKHVRAFVRLVADVAPKGAAKRLRRRARDLARDLSTTRDSEAAVEAFDLLRDELGEPDLAPGVRSRLVEARDAARADAAAPVDRDALASALTSLHEEIAAWPLAGADLDALLARFAESYAASRRSFRRARRKPTVERLHEWRKHVKRHVEHLKLLRPIWPELLRPTKSAGARLGERLGHDHDLAVLSDRADYPDLREAIARRRADLRAECFEVGGRLHALKPKALRRGMEELARVWREGA
ncbi:MAG: CHAD domain-containing protein [Planctomycetota bacterium JB042]